MSDNATHLTQPSKRQLAIEQLTRLYSKIQFLELPSNEFPTDELHQLSLLAEYSIHPLFSSKKIHQFHLKLTQKYWEKFQDLQSVNLLEMPIKRQSITQQDLNQHVNNNKALEQAQKSNQIQQLNSNIMQPEISLKENATEAIIHQVKQIHVQLKVSKNYNEIKKFLAQFDYEKALQNQNIGTKINILNSWTPVSCKILSLTQKKVVQTPLKIDSASYLQNIKMGKNARKESNNAEPSKTIILGKNESTQTKQMKHMLKVQAKTNFVEEKKKEESKLDDIQKKSIELNYLLNVITKQFFDDFFNDVLKIVRSNGNIIEVLCQKIIDKVKEEHNFIEIYVQLIRKLTKSSLSETVQNSTNSRKFNELQEFLVTYLQQSFIKLITFQIEPSCSNFNQYKYQKQMMGMCKFIGKLIKDKILSKKIFKVCFWQIVYRYVEKVKENPQNDIVNECLIEAIVTISDSMGNPELLKLMQKQKALQTKENEETIEESRFQEMMMALVDPNDQDQISRQKSYNNLIESIRVEEYPHILSGLMQIFGSKRMKLQFLIEHWKEKIQLLKSTSIQNLEKLQTDRQAKIQQQQVVGDITDDVQEDLFQIKKQIHHFITEVKQHTDLNKNPKKPVDPSLKMQENIVRKFFGVKQSSQANYKAFKLLVIEFFNQFADCKQFEIVQERVKYFLNFAKSLGLKQDLNSLLLDIICKEELQNLMIIECDFHFLIDGLCLVLAQLMHKTHVSREEVQEKMRQSYDSDDEDMKEFCQKVNQHLTKMCQNGNSLKFMDEEVLED